MKALIAYENKTGHTRQTAEAIAEAVRGLQGEVVFKPVEEVRPVDVQLADVLFIGAWVQGTLIFNVKPAGARQWVPNLPALMGKPTGVFCTYLLTPGNALQMLTTLLEDHGAKVRNDRAFHRSRPNAGVEEFVRSVVESASAPTY